MSVPHCKHRQHTRRAKLYQMLGLSKCDLPDITSGPSLMEVYSTGSMYISFLERLDLPELGFMN